LFAVKVTSPMIPLRPAEKMPSVAAGPISGLRRQHAAAWARSVEWALASMNRRPAMAERAASMAMEAWHVWRPAAFRRPLTNSKTERGRSS